VVEELGGSGKMEDVTMGYPRCDWTCPICAARCGGKKGHPGEHQCPVHYTPPPKPLTPEEQHIKDQCKKGIYPAGRCTLVQTCLDADIPCYGTLCDDCSNTCKGEINGSNFSIGACIKYVHKKVTEECVK